MMHFGTALATYSRRHRRHLHLLLQDKEPHHRHRLQGRAPVFNQVQPSLRL